MAAKPPEDEFPNGRGGRSAPADWRLPLPAAPREAEAVEEYGPDQPAINGFSTQRAGQVKRQKIRRKTRSFAYRCGRGGWRREGGRTAFARPLPPPFPRPGGRELRRAAQEFFNYLLLSISFIRNKRSVLRKERRNKEKEIDWNTIPERHRS